MLCPPLKGNVPTPCASPAVLAIDKLLSPTRGSLSGVGRGKVRKDLTRRMRVKLRSAAQHVRTGPRLTPTFSLSSFLPRHRLFHDRTVVNHGSSRGAGCQN